MRTQNARAIVTQATRRAVPFVQSRTMATFSERRDLTMLVQEETGMLPSDVGVIRGADRSAQGTGAFYRTKAYKHQQGYTAEEARVLFAHLPVAYLNNPGTAVDAAAISKLAQNGGLPTPAACVAMLGGGEATQEALTYYAVPSGVIITGERNSKKFIVFVYNNMDEGHRVMWYDLTGREQFEWHAAFVKAARTHLRTENHTRGLRGTDIGQLTTVAMVTVALTISPSLQYRRPDGHPIAAAQWPAARRRLFG